MSALSPAALRLSRGELEPVVDELARRFGDAGGDGGDGGDGGPTRITVRELTVGARQAVADLLGIDRLPAARLRLPVTRLVDALGLTSVTELRHAVEELRGTIPDRRAQRVAASAAREDLWRWLAEQADTVRLGRFDGGPPRLSAWAQAQRSIGVRGSVEVCRERFESALTVLRALPADGVALASLASDHAGGPHALDHGRSLAAIVLDAVACAAETTRPEDAEGVRQLWESVGVVPDPLSSTVLALGLPGIGAAGLAEAGDSPLAGWLGEAARACEPVVLTLAMLRRWPLAPLPPGARVFVVENPSLVAEAASAGWGGRPPLVCSSGRPTVATVTLLRQLTADGATALQHADFDPAGLAITGWLAERAGTTPWRMGHRDYLTAVKKSGSRPLFDGKVAATPWDPRLREVAQREHVPVYEEALRVGLIAAMTAPGASGGACAPVP